jgi:hypothetical protein
VIDLNLLRENPEAIKASQRAREADESLVDQAVAADVAWRKALQEFEALRAEQNASAKLVGAASKEDRPALIEAGKALAEQVKAANEAANEAEAALQALIWQIENVVIEGIPAGGEDNFVVIKDVGTKATFAFEPRDHVALGELLDIIDIERGVKVSGSRFYFLKGWGARLELAMMNMALDLASKHNFTALVTPTLVRPEVMAGTGFLGCHRGLRSRRCRSQPRLGSEATRRGRLGSEAGPRLVAQSGCLARVRQCRSHPRGHRLAVGLRLQPEGRRREHRKCRLGRQLDLARLQGQRFRPSAR